MKMTMRREDSSRGSRIVESPYVIVQAVVYDALWPDFPLGDALELSSARGGPRSASSRKCAAMPRYGRLQPRR